MSSGKDRINVFPSRMYVDLRSYFMIPSSSRANVPQWLFSNNCCWQCSNVEHTRDEDRWRWSFKYFFSWKNKAHCQSL